jgi:hypothetical protein
VVPGFSCPTKKTSIETLHHGLYISRSITFRINAWNEAKNFVNKSIIEERNKPSK